MKRVALAVQGVLRKAVKRSEANEQRRKLWVIDEFEVEFFLRAGRGEDDVERNHGRWRAEFAGDCREVIARDCADRAADVYDFGGGEIRGERRQDAAACHGN